MFLNQKDSQRFKGTPNAYFRGHEEPDCSDGPARLFSRRIPTSACFSTLMLNYRKPLLRQLSGQPCGTLEPETQAVRFHAGVASTH